VSVRGAGILRRSERRIGRFPVGNRIELIAG